MSRMSDQVGRVLGDRYRLLAPVGRGASAQVFVATDVRLGRHVAVKVLHDALAEDQGFLRRFRAEAQAAAALNHPHVLAVYDWGHDEGDVPWIVTEYLGGGSLRGLLDRGHRLTPSQALLVGLHAAQGLEYAHARGFVHRDVKPANLLFGDDGRLRIADFGLARALAEAALTEPHGAAVGTARYASPEQAQGRALTGRSDVYSLALVLVEVVTGTVPFSADTTLGTLMARVDRPLPVPDALGPLAEVVAEAGLADPEARPDAREVVEALTAVARRLPRPGPLPLAGALDADLADDHDPTVLARDRTAVAATRPDAGPGPVAGPVVRPVPDDPDDLDDDDDLDVPGFVRAEDPPPWRPDDPPPSAIGEATAVTGSGAVGVVDEGWDDEEGGWDDEEGEWDDEAEDEGGDWGPLELTGPRTRGLGLVVLVAVVGLAVVALLALAAALGS